MVILLNVRAVVVDLCTVIFGILQRFYPAAVCTLIFRPPLLVSGGYNNINGHSDFSRGVINGQIIGVSVLVQTAEYRDQLRQVVELGKAGLGAVACPLGNEFVKMISLIFLNLTNRLKRNLPEPRVCIYP